MVEKAKNSRSDHCLPFFADSAVHDLGSLCNPARKKYLAGVGEESSTALYADWFS